MIYILTEDSGSGMEFWRAVSNAFKEDWEYTFVADGHKTLGGFAIQDQFNSIVKQIMPGDEVLICIDNVVPYDEGYYNGDNDEDKVSKFSKRSNKGTLQYCSSLASQIDAIRNKCMEAFVEVKVTAYYCIEELMLSYSEVPRMYRESKPDQKMLNALEYVNYCIMNGIAYGVKRDAIKESGINLIEHRNREKIAKYILSVVTRRMIGHFSIPDKSGVFTQNGSGRCWVFGCDYIRTGMQDGEIKNVCDLKCKYICKNTDSRSKLIHIQENSLCVNSNIKLSQL